MRMAFPRTEAHDLLGAQRTIPDHLPGTARLLIIAFRRSQQTTVEQWLAHAGQMRRRCEGLTAWEVPVISNVYASTRAYVEGGMLAGSADGERARQVLTVYTDPGRFARALSIPDFESVHALLLDGAGDIAWRAAGAPDVDALERLDAALERICGPLAD